MSTGPCPRRGARDRSGEFHSHLWRLARTPRDIRAAIERVVSSGWFVLGPEVEAFETEFAAASRASHAIGVGNGTDAIAVDSESARHRRGDEVITTPLTAGYTVLAILMAGARPVFADIDPERLTIDPDAVGAAVTSRTGPSSRSTCMGRRPTWTPSRVWRRGTTWP